MFFMESAPQVLRDGMTAESTDARSRASVGVRGQELAPTISQNENHLAGIFLLQYPQARRDRLLRAERWNIV
jgi:hypothetical protein